LPKTSIAQAKLKKGNRNGNGHSAYHHPHCGHREPAATGGRVRSAMNEDENIEHAWPPEQLVEGVDYVYDDVMQADGSVKRVIIRRPRP
jgi:hypothetical protein